MAAIAHSLRAGTLKRLSCVVRSDVEPESHRDPAAPHLRRIAVAVLLWAIVGMLTGWLARRLLKSPHGLVVKLLRAGLMVDLLLGLVGALLGGFLARALLNAHGRFSNTNVEQVRAATHSLTVTSSSIVGQVIVALIGAVVVLALYRVAVASGRLRL